MIAPKMPKMLKVLSVKQNVGKMSRSVVALRNKIRRGYSAGVPEDQSTAAERKIVRDYPQYFENDRGYIKVKVTGKRRAKNPTEQDVVNFIKREINSTTDTQRVIIIKAIKHFGKPLIHRHRVKIQSLFDKRFTPNPYKSEAQRRKFHALAERGEISQSVVNEFDRESKGLELPERVVNPKKYTLASLAKDTERLYKQYADNPFAFRNAVGAIYGITNARAKQLFEYLERKHKKRNATAHEFKQHQKIRLQELVAKFQGHANGLKHRLLEADTAPKHKYLLGCLALMKVKANGKIIPIEFDGAAYLAADLRNNLHAVGKDAVINNVKKPNPGHLRELGKLVQIDYITAKSHIENGETVRFWHKLGEVDGEHPTLYIDSDGFPIINGGGYDIWDVGIVN